MSANFYEIDLIDRGDNRIRSASITINAASHAQACGFAEKFSRDDERWNAIPWTREPFRPGPSGRSVEEVRRIDVPFLIYADADEVRRYLGRS